MGRSPTRRRFLASLAVPLAGRPVAAGVGRTDGSSIGSPRQATFDPTVHGFGFRNWSTTVPRFPEHDHGDVAEDRVRESIERRWRAPLDRTDWLDLGGLPGSLLDLVARQVYVSINQRSATNGHCYGMVFAAQRYYERPDAIPLDHEAASEVVHPAEPLDSAAEPVGSDVDRFQTRQFFDLDSWLGRRMLLRPSWIDYEAQLSRLTAAVDEYGTAGITLLSTSTRALHQVLVHGYRRTSAGVSLALYDPNWSAADYAARDRDEWRRLDVDLRDERAVVGPYGSQEYDAFVFNHRDRAIADRTDLGPGAGVDGANAAGAGDDQPDEGLLPAALFLVTAADVQVSVVGPAGRAVGRDVSSFMDRSHTEYHAMRYRYGAEPGRYRVALTGADDAEYTLEVLVAGTDGTILDASASDTITAGEAHRYVATIPESADGSGTLERIDGRGPHIGLVGAGVGVAGLAAGGYAVARGRRRKNQAGEGDSTESVE